MRECDVRTAEDALRYIADCQLATVCNMAMKKRRPKYEFERQVSIAQKCVDWMVQMGIPSTGTRVEEVEIIGNVETWAKQHMPKN